MSKSRSDSSVSACPCESGQAYAQCCAPLHAGAPASSAAALMRSRYSAYVLQLDSYLLSSWHSSTRPAAVPTHEPGTRWLGLRIVAQDNPDEAQAFVEFIARFRVGGGSARRLHERSRFVREQGHWFYLDGEFRSD